MASYGYIPFGDKDNQAPLIRFIRPAGSSYTQQFQVGQASGYYDDVDYTLCMVKYKVNSAEYVKLGVRTGDSGGRRHYYALLGGTNTALQWTEYFATTPISFEDIGDMHVEDIDENETFEYKLGEFIFTVGIGDGMFHFTYATPASTPDAVYDFTRAIFYVSDDMTIASPISLAAYLNANEAKSLFAELDTRLTAIESLLGSNGLQAMFVSR